MKQKKYSLFVYLLAKHVTTSKHHSIKFRENWRTIWNQYLNLKMFFCQFICYIYEVNHILNLSSLHIVWLLYYDNLSDIVSLHLHMYISRIWNRSNASDIFTSNLLTGPYIDKSSCESYGVCSMSTFDNYEESLIYIWDSDTIVYIPTLLIYSL